MKKIWRHGDLLIVKVESIPQGLEKRKDNVLLEGEATGHYHRISGATIYKNSEEPKISNNFLRGYLEIDKNATITHEEHKTIELPAGTYKFLQQREWDEQEERAVID